MRLLFDIEANDILDKVTTVHCLVIKDVDTGEKWSYSSSPEMDSPVADGLVRLFHADELIGHNIIGYDLPALKKVYGWEPDPSTKIFDTLVAVRVVWPEIEKEDYAKLQKNSNYVPGACIGSQGLKAWGYRLGTLKGAFNETNSWEKWSAEMQTYCEQDVEVNHALFQHIEKQNYSDRCFYDVEMPFARLMFMLEQHGIRFNEAEAGKLAASLIAKKEDLTRKLQEAFPPRVEEMKTPEYYVAFGPFDMDAKAPTKGAAAQLLKDQGVKAKDITYMAGPFKKKLHPFNPGSRPQIADRLKGLGWVPSRFTEKGTVQVDDEALEEIVKELDCNEAKLLGEYLQAGKILGRLSEGAKSWMKNCRNGRVHQGMITNGAVTGRCTHKIVANVPRVSSPYGEECRALFMADEGQDLVGTDASGLELRCLGHYMAPYDGGAYAKEVIEGDVHTLNCTALGLEPKKVYVINGKQSKGRDFAKTWIYAYLYGAGPEKLGTAGGGVTDENIASYPAEYADLWIKMEKMLEWQDREITGKTVALMVKGELLKDNFEAKTPALKILKAAILLKVTDPKNRRNWKKIQQAQSVLRQAGQPIPSYTGYLVGIDGRLLHIRSSHSALNTLLQNAGAVAVKRATVVHNLLIQTEGLKWARDYAFILHMHDEWQTTCLPSLSKHIGTLAVKAIEEAGKFLGFKCPLTGEAKIGKNWKDCH